MSHDPTLDYRRTAEACIEALQEISEASGPFKADHDAHMESCIRSMQAVAIDVLKRHGITPRGVSVDER